MRSQKHPVQPRPRRRKINNESPCLDCSEHEKAVDAARTAANECRAIVECIGGYCKTIMLPCEVKNDK